MTRKVNEENERIKRSYLTFMKEAKRADETTVVKAAEAILRFEASTGYKSFKNFHIDQVRSFKSKLNSEKSKATGKPLAKATISGILRACKAFFLWLAGQPGYKSKISYSDSEYFNQNGKDARIAHAQREARYPTLAQCRHAFDRMPCETQVERRNKAVFAFLMITAARDGAIASFRLKHIDLMEGVVYQDAREVRTKNSKTFHTWFLPIDPVYRECFDDWVTFLREELLFGNDDPLFPPPQMAVKEGRFAVVGFKREIYSNAGPIREAIKAAFSSAGLEEFAPHSFRKTIVKWGVGFYKTPEALKAFSQNIGHESLMTTYNTYLPVSSERQAELIRMSR